VIKKKKKKEKEKPSKLKLNNTLGLIHNKSQLTTLKIWKQQKVLKTII
jgi:hypothetical protein